LQFPGIQPYLKKIIYLTKIYFLLVGIIDPKSNRAQGQKDGRARDVLAEDSEIPFPSGVVQSGSGSGSNLNRYQDDPEIEGFPSGSGENESSFNFVHLMKC
jgi:hypothetical protein